MRNMLNAGMAVHAVLLHTLVGSALLRDQMHLQTVGGESHLSRHDHGRAATTAYYADIPAGHIRNSISPHGGVLVR